MQPNTRRITWDDVEPGMQVYTDEDCAPREVENVSNAREVDGVSSKTNHLYVSFKNGGGHTYAKSEVVRVVTEGDTLDPMKFRESYFLAVDKPLEDLLMLHRIFDRRMITAEEMGFFFPKVKEQWDHLKKMMEGAGFE